MTIWPRPYLIQYVIWCHINILLSYCKKCGRISMGIYSCRERAKEEEDDVEKETQTQCYSITWNINYIKIRLETVRHLFEHRGWLHLYSIHSIIFSLFANDFVLPSIEIHFEQLLESHACTRASRCPYTNWWTDTLIKCWLS